MDQRICAADDCDRAVHAAGYCRRHYDRLRTHGTIDIPNPHAAFGEPLRWLTDAVNSRDRSTCWLDWPYAVSWGYPCACGTKAGHVAMRLDGRPRPAPPGNHMRHDCDRPLCVNPDHLRWGTNRENTDDKINRGRLRAGWVPGEANGRARLSAPDVIDIRRRLVRGNGGNSAALAAEYAVSVSHILSIGTRRTWGHLPE